MHAIEVLYVILNTRDNAPCSLLLQNLIVTIIHSNTFL